MGTAARAIRVKDVAKRYRIGRRDPYQTLRETIGDVVRAPLQRLAHGPSPRSSADDTIWALDGVSFDIDAGEVVGIIGRNGAGKTTLLKILSRITAPTRGDVEIIGRVGTLLEIGAGFHGELTGRENIYFSGAVLGMRKAEIDRRFDAIVAFAELEKFLETPVKRYSSGMYMRLAFSVAAHLEANILLVDEVLAWGDASFQRNCLNKMEEVSKTGRTVLFVSHNVPSVLRLCDRVILLERGVVAADGRPHEVVGRYLSSNSGSAAERTWPELEQAPGDDVARIRGVRVLNELGVVTETVDVGDSFLLEVEYWKLQESRLPVAAFHVFNEEGLCLFASSAFGAPFDPASSARGSLVRARCRIPAHLLAEGRVFILAAVVSYSPDIFHVFERDVLSFQVVDRRNTDAVREHYAGDWPGVVRPRLEWEVRTELGR